MVRGLSGWGIVVCGLLLASLTWGQEAAAGLDPTELTPDQRQALLMAAVAEYRVTLAGDRAPLKLYPNPLLRFTNDVGGVVDGLALMWTDEGRPAVVAQVFVIKNGMWLHEFQSMALRPLALKQGEKVRWQPAQPGAEFRTFPDAPPAEGTRAGRLSQMKSLARQFAVSEDFRVRASDKETTKYELRMLAQPVYRYAEGSGKRDGAVFAFVHGTDPEALLTLEAALDSEPREWKYAWAPLTCWALQARLKDREVWESPETFGKSALASPYHVWRVEPDLSRLPEK